MTVTQSTFGATEAKFATLEQQPEEVQTPTETPSEQPAEQPLVESVVEQPQEEQPQEIDYSTSSFSLGGEEVATEPTATEPAAAQPQFNLDEELKKVDRKELLKKLGVNDFAIEINDHLTNGGSALDYLNAKSIDYNQVSDENLIKQNLQKQFPTFTPQQIDLFFNRKYGVSEVADDEDKEMAALTLKAEAHTIRQKLIDNQKQFKIPEATTPQTDEAYEQWKQYRDSQQQLIERNNGYYLNHAATKSLHENKKVAINVGDGVPAFNITIDKPELITRSFTDGGETWQRLTSTPTGEPDVPTQQLIALFSFNPKKFAQDIFNYGLQQGKRSLVSEGQNAQRPTTKVLPMNPEKPFAVSGQGKFGDKNR